ncbi:Cytochrome P450 716B1 [Dichanthelium oligosanthes]|uniref:Cytochrome P450 716B1 n=1 Tax=Dichanthelium oligosanthes TaxID=888268 RepID=A0A1E5VNY0_9POAL|nr:Cytochrome P450 716B1 [Dichanthelium oligosanthes]
MDVDSTTMTMAAALAIVAALLVSLPVLYRLLFAGAGDKTSKKAVPPGSFGLPVVGHTLSLLGALRSNTAEDWLRRRVAAYGPVSRLSLFGYRTAFLVGPAANKFLFTSPALTTMNTEAFRRMVGRRTVRDVVGDEHARVRAMMVQFLRLDAVKRYVAGMDAEVRRHLDAHWRGRGAVAVMPSMKSLTFDVMSTVLFGLGRDSAVRRELSAEFQQLVQGIWSVPLNLPFTRFSRCLAASRRGRRAVAAVIEERRAKLERGESSPADDIITHMLSKGLADEQITDNVMFLMVAAHDTSAALITFLLRHLDANKDAYAKVLHEQEEIARCKAAGEALSWEDLCKMRYTWAAAMETLRLVPPAFSMLRRALTDVEYGGYLIPKGWQVMYATNMTHWDLAIFPDPGRFDPARFEDPSAIPPYGFVPFGGGARICPGNEFSKVETLVAVHHIVTRFRWKLAAGCDGSFSRSPMPYPSQGLLIDIEPIQ